MFIRMIPTCECGYIFDKFSMAPALIDESTLYFDKTIVISPSKCPGCGEMIEGIMHQHSVDGVFEYDKEKYIIADQRRKGIGR